MYIFKWLWYTHITKQATRGKKQQTKGITLRQSISYAHEGDIDYDPQETQNCYRMITVWAKIYGKTYDNWTTHELGITTGKWRETVYSIMSILETTVFLTSIAIATRFAIYGYRLVAGVPVTLDPEKKPTFKKPHPLRSFLGYLVGIPVGAIIGAITGALGSAVDLTAFGLVVTSWALDLLTFKRHPKAKFVWGAVAAIAGGLLLANLAGVLLLSAGAILALAIVTAAATATMLHSLLSDKYAVIHYAITGLLSLGAAGYFVAALAGAFAAPVLTLGFAIGLGAIAIVSLAATAAAVWKGYQPVANTKPSAEMGATTATADTTPAKPSPDDALGSHFEYQPIIEPDSLTAQAVLGESASEFETRMLSL